MEILIHPRSVGQSVVIKGKTEIIHAVLASKTKFRIRSESNKNVINDYSFDDIDQATDVTMSLDGGTVWHSMSIRKLPL